MREFGISARRCYSPSGTGGFTRRDTIGTVTTDVSVRLLLDGEKRVVGLLSTDRVNEFSELVQQTTPSRCIRIMMAHESG